MTNLTVKSNIITSENLLAGNQHTLCVIMPAYNEGNAIRENLLEASRIISTFSNDYLIIAVNDGSTDHTQQEMIEAAALDQHVSYISYSNNMGKGGAITMGVKYANAKYIAFLDSDLELNPIMLKDFVSSMEKEQAHVVIGSKMHKDSKLEYPAFRRFLSLGYYIFLKLLFKLKIKDTQTGIKLFQGNILKPICESLSTTGFAFDIEILAKATKKNYRIIEMPIELHFNRDRAEKSRFSPKVIFKIFKETMSIRKVVKAYH